MSGNLPKLPGYSVYVPPCMERQNLAKGQTLTYTRGHPNEAPIMSTDGYGVRDSIPAANITGIGSIGSVGSPKSTSSPTTTGSLPKWVEQDKKVLRFYGYFKEAVTESNMENHRVRRVMLLYYLADDSLQITEPKQDNSGIPQGVFLKRHRVPKEAAEGAGFISPLDFAVGSTITVYGRTYFLVDTDSFTRSWYEENLQQTLEQAGSYPSDPVDAYKATFGLGSRSGSKKSNDLATFVEARLGKPSHLLEGDKLKQFLANNGKVLRFWAVWDDRSDMYGDRRPYVVHIYLEDDTIEINECYERNSGRDPFPVFLKRGSLPKEKPRGATLTGRFPKSMCYKPQDFRTGLTINVLGRDFFLHDCDDFTRQWYQAELGYPTELLEKIDITEPIVPLPKAALPPYNGYGTLDDSKQNCVALVPKPPKKDMHKLMNKDKIIMRFTMRMISTERCQLSHADVGRRFVLSYFLMDDSLLIFEPPVRNSGITGGKFLERQRVYKPNSEEIYTYQDLYAGGQLEVFGRCFELLEADEYTTKYMENNKHIFVMADADAIIKSLRVQVQGAEQALRTALVEVDPEGLGQLNLEQTEVAMQAAGLKFTRHQLVAVRRRVDRERSGYVTTDELLQLLGLSQKQ